jgi:hypothetical protein
LVTNEFNPYRYEIVSLQLQPDAVPGQFPPRKVPLALEKRVFEALQAMEKDGIIEKVRHPTLVSFGVDLHSGFTHHIPCIWIGNLATGSNSNGYGRPFAWDVTNAARLLIGGNLPRHQQASGRAQRARPPVDGPDRRRSWPWPSAQLSVCAGLRGWKFVVPIINACV